MFLEVYVFNSPTVTEAQVYEEETLPDFPPTDILKEKIEALAANVKWLNEETGEISTSDYKGQVIFGNDKKAIYFRIVGGSDPVKLVLNLCHTNGWTSYTPENEYFLDASLDTVKYWQDYKSYRGMIDGIFYKGRGANIE